MNSRGRNLGTVPKGNSVAAQEKNESEYKMQFQQDNKKNVMYAYTFALAAHIWKGVQG